VGSTSPKHLHGNTLPIIPSTRCQQAVHGILVGRSVSTPCVCRPSGAGGSNITHVFACLVVPAAQSVMRAYLLQCREVHITTKRVLKAASAWIVLSPCCCCYAQHNTAKRALQVAAAWTQLQHCMLHVVPELCCCCCCCLEAMAMRQWPVV
jgi:hypothetical protein